MRISKILPLFMILLVAGCTTTGAGEAPPSLAFEKVSAFPVNVSAVRVLNQYDPHNDSQDVSSSFAGPPDVAMKAYAERRFQAAGGSGTMEFTIQTASVHHRAVTPENKFLQWTGEADQDEYEVFYKIGLVFLSDQGVPQGQRNVWTFKRTVTLAERLSLAERDARQREFLASMIEYVGSTVIQELRANDAIPH